MKFPTRAAIVLVLVLGAACSGPARQPAEVASPAPERDVSGAVLYTVNPAASEVHIQVLRGGVLANLGHNHVITSRSLAGRIWLHPTLAGSAFDLFFPVEELVIDDPRARAAAGAEFAAPIADADREGTRRNMLGPEVLDAQRHPRVRLASLGVTPGASGALASTRITLRDVSRSVDVPVTLSVDDGRVIASGEFEILQSEFGITPFRVALGALTVQDRLSIRYRIVADRAD